MAEVIGVRFKDVGKIYYFNPDGQSLSKGQKIIVETAKGTECGEVVMENQNIADNQIVQPLKKFVRLATDEDLKRVEQFAKKEREAFSVCQKKIIEHGLDMHLTEVEYSFDGSKILFYFTADGRIDFRELVKDLASIFRIRIELRQIGVRDEAKMLGGIGICGQVFCCSRFLGDFQSVSIKMAKEQSLSLNPTKISGTCGRLMCCLKYEQSSYESLSKETPAVGSFVKTPDGKGKVTERNILTGMLKVRLDKEPDVLPRAYDKKSVTAIKKSEERKDS